MLGWIDVSAPVVTVEGWNLSSLDDIVSHVIDLSFWDSGNWENLVEACRVGLVPDFQKML